MNPEDVARAVASGPKARGGTTRPAAGAPPRQRPGQRPLPAGKGGRGSGKGPGRNGRSPRRARLRDWLRGARIRTLPMAIAPVLVGTGAAHLADGFWHGRMALLCLAIAVFMILGVNFANDYSDGVRGTDDVRTGPPRLTGGGLARPRTVLTVAMVFFGLAAAAGLLAVILSGRWWLLIVGAAAIAAAWFYTGGRRPYGYIGLGELAVFLFFGLAGTVGTTYLQTANVPQESWIGAVAVGCIAVATLVSNNIRDIPTDRAAGKRTLSVLIGALWSRVLYIVLMLVPFAVLALYSLFYFYAPYVFFTAFIAVPAMIIAATARSAREWILVLGLTNLFALFYALGLGIAFAF